MPSLSSINRSKTVMIITAIVGVIGLYCLLHSKVWLQQHNMALGMDHVPVIRQAMGDDKRFDQVEFQPSTDSNGSLMIMGYVCEGNLTTLKEIVMQTKPPVPIRWGVREFPREDFENLLSSPEKKDATD
jgi:hypothetical protein